MNTAKCVSCRLILILAVFVSVVAPQSVFGCGEKTVASTAGTVNTATEKKQVNGKKHRGDEPPPLSADAGVPGCGPAPTYRYSPLILSPEQIASSLIQSTRPNYPAALREKGIKGAVQVYVVIGMDGGAHGLVPISGDLRLLTESIIALRHWRFRPYLDPRGYPRAVPVVIEIDFQVSDDGSASVNFNGVPI